MADWNREKNVRGFQSSTSSRTIRNPINDNWREKDRNLYRPRDRSISFHSLEYLIQVSRKNSEEIILNLVENLDDFRLFLESNLKADWIVLISAILAKVCSSSFRKNKFAILKTAIEASFLQKLDNYVRILNSDKNVRFWENPEEFFINLLLVCDFFTELRPNNGCEILPKLLEDINTAVLYLEEQRNVKIAQKTKLNIETLMKKLEKRNGENKNDSTLSSFRTLDVDITSKDILKPNDIPVSKYFVDNVEHYLDVQFRLLKEYFVAPFRENITKCIEHMNGINILSTLSEHGIYADVVLRSKAFIENGISAILKFTRQEDINEFFHQRGNKIFRISTLVYLSKDNFSSVLIGHVIEIDYEQDHIKIGFKSEYNNCDLSGSYTVVGTEIYYQPYYYVLKALQYMSGINFPMKKYLIDADPSVERPGYLNSSRSVYTIHGKAVDLFGNNWPSADQLNMDSSQYSAFKAVLTEKFNVIQGFPGTGKTYLGLQIVKTLLHEDNRKFWYNGTPILIVCASYRDLDTFLESLISTSSKIIRIGENAGNEKIEKFLLKTARKDNHAYYSTAATWKKKIEKASNQMKEWIRHLNQLKKFNVILNFTQFETIDENVKSSWFSQASNSDLRTWLFDEEENQNVNPHSIEISKLINDILRKDFERTEADFDCKDDETLFEKKRPVLADAPLQKVLLSKSHLWIQIVGIARKLRNLETQNNKTDYIMELEAKLIDLWQIYQIFKEKMSDQALSQPSIKPINVDYDSPHGMDSKDRWDLYFYWLNLYISFVERKIVELQYEHQELVENLIEVGQIYNLEIIKRSLILGITVHSALRLQTTLQALKCRIVIVEEASQVLEPQLVVFLTKHCEHLILLGDHQKLRPIVAKDNINKSKNSAISVLERMIDNKTKCHVLRVQHRMSTEISQLLVPRFYPEFESYSSVTKYPAILGIPFCKFFFQYEPQIIDEYYLCEAKFLINLACYMRQVGYEPEDITILTSGEQKLVLCNESKKYEKLLKGVSICTLGKYHGQECKVILLSLVKNNFGGKIGYLKIESGIIFALSRAKERLYMMGDINALCENNDTWPKVKEILVEQKCLENYFPLCCQMNPNHITQIKNPEDFDKIPKGVCSEICGSALSCGHRCLKSCYILDCDHTEICLK